jgi:hypothetical protein
MNTTMVSRPQTEPTPPGPLFATICDKGHPMQAQRDGNLYEINPDQSVTIIEGGAVVDYEYISCSKDCQDTSDEILEFAFEIIFNWSYCSCPAGPDHLQACKDE